MKLDRTTKANGPGTGKYALIKLRAIKALSPELQITVKDALSMLQALGVLDYAAEGDSECFVIRMKDKAAPPALAAYAASVFPHDREFGQEILHLVNRALEHPNKQWAT